MSWRIRAIAARLSGHFQRHGLDRQLDQEIQEHLRLLTDQFVHQGMSLQDAEHAARRQFGGIAQIQEDHRERRGLPFVENFWRDLAFTLRQIRKRPGFSLAAIAVLALGLGANAAIFSLVNGILLRSLPFAEPERLVGLFERDVIDDHNAYNSVAPANFLDWQRQARTLDQIAGIHFASFNLSGGSGPAIAERVDACACSANLFETLGVAPILGRAFLPEEDRPGSPRVAIISYSLWKRRYNGSSDVLSTVVRLNGEPYAIVGVMPPDFRYPAQSEQVWIPLKAYLPATVLEAHDNHILTVIGRLRHGASIAQARAEIDGIVSRYKRQHPEEVMGKGGNVVSLAEVTVKGIRTLLLLLFGAVGCVLLIASVNVANLLIARAVGRQREVAIRTALGAGRGRIVWQVLMESLVLSVFGALAGLLLASSLTDYLAARTPGAQWLPQTAQIRVDPIVLLFTLGLALVAGVAAGLYPALRASSFDIASGLKDTGRANSPSRSQSRFRDALITLEVALSLVLLVAAGLLIRSFDRLLSTDLGLRTEHTLAMRISLPDTRYRERTQVAAFLKELVDRLQSAPGVLDAGLSSCPTVTDPGFCPDTVFQIENQPSPAGRLRDAQYRAVDPSFFRASGIPLLQGRPFTSRDGIGLDDSQPHTGQVIINQALAKRFFAAQDPIGRYLTLYWFVGNNSERTLLRYEVIGVAANVLERPQAAAYPTFYVPILDGDFTDISVILHTTNTPRSIVTEARSIVHRMDADLPVFGIQLVSESVGETARDRQFTMTLIASLAGLAVVLAAVGLYGVVSWGVSQRVNEISIRMALGATFGEVRKMILLEGLRPALLGVAIGIPGAAFATGLLRSLLFQVRPFDPLTFVVVPLMLLAVAALASLLPAIRATRIDPTAGLRSE
jgi:putative ABC transport system permease protein